MKFRRLIIILHFVICAVSFSAQSPRSVQWIQEEQFLRACQDGDLDAVKRFLAIGISPNVRDRFGQPAIIRAARGGIWTSHDSQAAVLRTLIDAGADINATNEFGSTAIFLTESGNQIKSEAHKLLLSMQTGPRRRDIYGLDHEQRPTFESHVKVDESEKAWRMLLEGDLGRWPSMPKRHKNSATFRMAASYYGDLPAGSPPKGSAAEIDDNGETYLFYMASRDQFSVDEFSDIEPEAVNIVSKTGESALIRAARFDNGYLVRRLLGNGADTSVRDKAGHNALDYAAEYDYHLTTLTLLLKADPRVKDRGGNTALMRAAKMGNHKAVLAFVNGRLSADEAAAEAKLDPEKSKELTLTANALKRIDPDQQDQKGMTALMLAVENGHVPMVEALLRINANKAIKDKSGRTALMIARAKGHSEIVEILMKK